MQQQANASINTIKEIIDKPTPQKENIANCSKGPLSDIIKVDSKKHKGWKTKIQ